LKHQRSSTKFGGAESTKLEPRALPNDRYGIEKSQRNVSIKKFEKYRFRSDKPDHVWAELPDEEFLTVLGALAKDEDGVLRPTAAGLLMFAPDYQITREFPHYFLDYQENDGSNERWTDRFISSSGDWSGNLYDFYYKVINRITQDVKVPFKLDETATRIDDTPVHKALQATL
jgi:predicted HTH transcriptional regulator